MGLGTVLQFFENIVETNLQFQALEECFQPTPSSSFLQAAPKWGIHPLGKWPVLGKLSVGPGLLLSHCLPTLQS